MKSAVWSDDELANIQNKDRLLPSQPYFSKMYKGSDFYGDMEKLLGSMYEPLKLDIKTKDGVTYAVLGSDFNTLRFYQFLIKSHGYKNILELGTYIGVSAMYLSSGKTFVTTLEKGTEFHDIACRNIKENGYGAYVHALCADAIEWLTSCKKLYDLIIIDCAKESYKELFKLSLRRLTLNGTILVDDVFFQGETLDGNPTSEKGIGVKAMLDYVAGLQGYEKVILPIGNGLLMVRKC